jgi:hypothetical protein
MPVRIPLITDPAARVLLDGLVDFAGLFPPASLSMPDAVKQYAKARGGDAGWMLGRFVCPVAQLESFGAVAEPLLPRDAGAIPWRLSAIGTGDHAADAAAIAVINESHRWSWDECSAIVDTVETRASSVAEIEQIDRAFGAQATVYVELAPDAELAPLLAALARTGRRAKLRTGGVVSEAFPSADVIVNFIDGCVEAGVPFKATAGLHHAMCGHYALTYAADSDSAPMYGYLNIALTVALRLANAPRDVLLEALRETDRASIRFSDESLRWRSHTFDRTRIAHMREHVFTSFGSCSFAEPVSEGRAMGAW